MAWLERAFDWAERQNRWIAFPAILVVSVLAVVVVTARGAWKGAAAILRRLRQTWREGRHG